MWRNGASRSCCFNIRTLWLHCPRIKVSKTFIILYINFTQYHVCLFDLGLSSPEGQGSPKGPQKPKDSHLQLDGSIFKRRNLPPRAKGPRAKGAQESHGSQCNSFCATRSMCNYGAERLFSLVFSSLLPWAAQTAQTEEFIFQNVAYRPTVYRTGTISKTANIGKRLTLNENGLKQVSHYFNIKE